MKRNTLLKNALTAALVFALSGTTMAGCGNPSQDTPQDSSANISQETSSDTDAETPKESVADNPSDDAANSETDNSAEDAEQNTAGNADSGTTDDMAQAPETYEDNFAVDSQAAKEFAEKIKAAVAEQDLEALAALTAFPVYVGLPDVGGVETREDFLNLGAEAIFTDELSEAVQEADIENLRPSRAGFAISNGTANIIFGVRDGRLAISGINYPQ